VNYFFSPEAGVAGAATGAEAGAVVCSGAEAAAAGVVVDVAVAEGADSAAAGTVGAAGAGVAWSFSINPVLPARPCITVRTREVVMKIAAAA